MAEDENDRQQNCGLQDLLQMDAGRMSAEVIAHRAAPGVPQHARENRWVAVRPACAHVAVAGVSRRSNKRAPPRLVTRELLQDGARLSSWDGVLASAHIVKPYLQIQEAEVIRGAFDLFRRTS